MLDCIAAEHLDAIWPAVLPWFEAIERRSKGREAVASIRSDLERQNAQLWLWWRHELKALAVTEIKQFPGALVCRIRIVTGSDRDLWLADGMARIEEWAASIGCHQVETSARLGWDRDLKGLGYRKSHILCTKDLSHV